jgi:hypothetical protein
LLLPSRRGLTAERKNAEKGPARMPRRPFWSMFKQE